jgi:glycosyltransferase involved in cell wall biosynthesis
VIDRQRIGSRYHAGQPSDVPVIPTRPSGGPPLLSVGLPVYNGGRFLEEALQSILGQTFTDFELIISDNASTDTTPELCCRYAVADGRVRYFRVEQNRGPAWNHNRVLELARGKYFKWANHDDVCHPELFARCLAVLENRPEVVLCHALVADIDADGRFVVERPYTLRTDDPRPDIRFGDLLVGQGGHDLYGIMRTDAARATPQLGSYHQYAERVKFCALGLRGTFHQVPEVLFFHREHPSSNRRTYPNTRTIAPVLDPRRANRLLHPQVRLHAEYLFNFLRAVRDAPLSPAERRRVCGRLAGWLARRGAERVGLHRAEP